MVDAGNILPCASRSVTIKEAGISVHGMDNRHEQIRNCTAEAQAEGHSAGIP